MRSTHSRSFTPALFVLAGVLALLAAACGAQTEAEPEAGEPAPATPGEGADPAEATITGNLTDGCVDAPDPDADLFPDKVEFGEATGVSVRYENTYKVVEVTPPQVPDAEPVRYVLLQCGAPEPELDGELADAQVVEIPVTEVVSLTTTNLPHFDVLGAVDRLIAVGDLDHVVTQSVLDRGDELAEFADETGAADLERLVDATPELLLIDGFGDAILDDVARYRDAGVPTAINADFNEQTLLGRAEWLKFTALFLNAEAEAEQVFREITDSYADVREAVAGIDERPRVLVNTPFEGTWFTPGGASFLANAIADGGGEYVFSDDDSTGSLQFDIETVLDRGADADVWIQAGSVHGTLDDIVAADERLGQFEAFTNGEVWAQDAWTSPTGGHAVFEIGYLRADWFLADLATVFHGPGTVEGHELRFFGRVPESQP